MLNRQFDKRRESEKQVQMCNQGKREQEGGTRPDESEKLQPWLEEKKRQKQLLENLFEQR